MTKEKLIKEMLNEVKNLKDLTKKNLPEIAKEYIRAEKAKNILLLVSGLSLTSLSAALVIYALFHTFDQYSSAPGALGFTASLLSTVSVPMVIISITNMIDLNLQPRRSAITAITSLINNKE